MNVKISAICAAALGLAACARDKSVEFDRPPPVAIVVLEGPVARAVPVSVQAPAPGGRWSGLRTPDVARELYDERKSDTTASPLEPPAKLDTSVSVRPPEVVPPDSSDNGE